MNLFEEWAELNRVISEWRCRFDVLREEMPKCKTRSEAIALLKQEDFYTRYPALPAWLRG